MKKLIEVLVIYANKLRSDKANRSTLSALFAEIAIRLRNEQQM